MEPLLTTGEWALRCLTSHFGISAAEVFVRARVALELIEPETGRVDYREMYVNKGIVPSYIEAYLHEVFPNRAEQGTEVPLLAAE